MNANHSSLTKSSLSILMFLGLFMGALTSSGKGQEGKTGDYERQLALITRTLERLYAKVEVSKEFTDRFQWPPEVELYQVGDPILEMVGNHNAFATVRRSDDGRKAALDDKGLYRTLVGVTMPVMKDWVGGDENLIALILGHEIGHLVLGHCDPANSAKPYHLARIGAGRKRELDADAFGLQIALAAGFSPKAIQKLWVTLKDLNMTMCSAQSVTDVHPSWEERFALLDPKRSNIWRSLGAFDDGLFFAALKDDAAAIRCFEQSVKYFPDAAEAHANLGLARLSLYIDNLRPADILKLEVGYVLTEGYYHRARSVEVELKGIDGDLWAEAIAALKKAIELDPKLALAHANLGLAQLVAPSGPKAAAAVAELTKALSLLPEDDEADDKARVCALVNLAVASFHAGDRPVAQKVLARVEQGIGALRSEAGSRQMFDLQWAAVYQAILYNRALFAEGEGEQVLSLWKDYVESSSTGEVWLPTARRKAGLIKGSAPDWKESSPTYAFPALSVIVNKHALRLGDDVIDVEDRLAGATKSKLTEDGLSSWKYPKLGLELVVDGRVLAIRLKKSVAPALEIRPMSKGSDPILLKVGTKLGDLPEFRSQLKQMGGWVNLVFAGSDDYFYVPYMGFAIRLGDEDVIQEIALIGQMNL